jgi:hypothetical protein
MAIRKINSRSIGDTGVATADIADGSITTAKLADSAVTSGKMGIHTGRRNKIINGAFQVWQRGTSFTTSAVSFAADRFAHYQAIPSSNNVTQSTDVPDGFTYSCSLNDAVDMRCTVELPGQGIAGEFYNGSTWTLSFYARSTGADLSYTTDMGFVNGPSYASYGGAWTSSNNSYNITSTWQRFEIQFTVNASPTNSHYAVGFVLGGTAGRSIRFTGIQLEAGDTATPFEHRSFGGELALCQRYYQKSYPYTNYAGDNLGAGSHGFIPIDSLDDVNIHFTQYMRATPTLTTYRKNGTATSSAQRADNGASYLPITVSEVRDNGFHFNPDSSVSRRYRLHYIADAEL